MTNYYRVSEIASARGKKGLLPVSTATIWRWVKAGEFPSPIKLSERCTVWDATQVQAWINSKSEGHAE